MFTTTPRLLSNLINFATGPAETDPTRRVRNTSLWDATMSSEAVFTPVIRLAERLDEATLDRIDPERFEDLSDLNPRLSPALKQEYLQRIRDILKNIVLESSAFGFSNDTAQERIDKHAEKYISENPDIDGNTRKWLFVAVRIASTWLADIQRQLELAARLAIAQYYLQGSRVSLANEMSTIGLRAAIHHRGKDLHTTMVQFLITCRPEMSLQEARDNLNVAQDTEHPERTLALGIN